MLCKNDGPQDKHSKDHDDVQEQHLRQKGQGRWKGVQTKTSKADLEKPEQYSARLAMEEQSTEIEN